MTRSVYTETRKMAHNFRTLGAEPALSMARKMILVDCASWLSRAFRAIGVLVAAILFSAVPSEAPGQQPQGENPFDQFVVSWADHCGTVDGDDWCKSIIYVNGEITVQTAERFEKALRQVHQHRLLFIVLGSLGGSVSAAMRIGRLIRNTGCRTVVGSGATCASACVLVFAAGLSRVVGARILNPSLILLGDWDSVAVQGPSKIGIHRPALADAPPETDMTSVKTAAERVEKELRKYAGEMNVSPRLIDDMLATPLSKSDGYLNKIDKVMG
jgi:ATP-dependent protease ClpP protease subunit